MSGRMRILIVDDDRGMTETLADLLEDLGYKTEVAHDGYEAIEKTRTLPIDLVLMDIRMPGINGVSTLKEIKNMRPEVVVMMMTAYSMPDYVNDALEEGALCVLDKPLDIRKAIELIGNIDRSALVLVVDDDIATCETLLDILEEYGVRVVKAFSGEEAIKRVKEKDFDLIFIDVKMPFMNGLELLLSLREISPDVRGILMTGYRDEVRDLVEAALENNALRCIYKPFSEKDLANVLRDIPSMKDRVKN